MRQRCGNPNNDGYYLYGARGISVCERWQSFENFLADMGERPDDMSIEREDGAGNYEPGNCRWATAKEQARNRSDNRMLTFEGEMLHITDWAERTGLSVQRIGGRLKRGWSVHDALTIPAGAGPIGRPRKRQII